MLSGCEEKHAHSIKVGMCPWPGYEPLFLAVEKKMIPSNIKIVRFSSPAGAYRAFKSGAIDVVGLTTDELLKYSDFGSLPKIFLILDVSNGADAIVAKPEIKTLQDMKGKTVALESSVLAQYILHRSMDKSQLKLSDFNLINIDILNQPEAYKQNKADVFVTFEPSKGVLKGYGATVLFDSSEIPNEIIDALAASEDVWLHHKSSLLSLKKSWYRALQYIEDNPKEAYETMARLEGISSNAFQESIKELKYGTRELNKKLLENEELLTSLKKLQAVMIDKRIIQNRINVEMLLGK